MGEPPSAAPVTDPEPPSEAGRRFGISGLSLPLLLSAVGAGLVTIRLLGPGWAEGFPAVWPDAVWPDESYLALAEVGPFRPGFWFGFRPPVYPLFCWLAFRSTRLIVLGQVLLACGAVTALAVTASRSLRSRPVAVAAMVFIVAIPLQARYSMWHTQILSESVAGSIGLLAVAAWWRFAASPSVARVVAGTAAVLAWMLVRDAHVLAAGVVLVPTLALTAVLGRGLGNAVRRALAVAAALVVVAAGYAYLAEGHTNRARLSFHNTVGVRVLPDPTLSRWFEARGMPLDDALRSRSGLSGLDDDFYKSEDPAFAEYRRWVDGAGRRAMLWSLVALAPHYGSELADELPTVLAGDVSYYDTDRVRDRMPNRLPGQLGGPSDGVGLAVWLAVAVICVGGGALVTRRSDPRRRALAFAATLLVLTLVEGYTTWAGDPVEMARHLVGTDLRLAIGLVVAIAIGTDALVAARRRSGPDPAPADATDPDPTAAGVGPRA